MKHPAVHISLPPFEACPAEPLVLPAVPEPPRRVPVPPAVRAGGVFVPRAGAFAYMGGDPGRH